MSAEGPPRRRSPRLSAHARPIKAHAEPEPAPVALRDLGPYSSRNTSKGALLQETALILQALGAGTSIDAVRDEVLSGRLLRQTAYRTRYRIWQVIRFRYLPVSQPWALRDLEVAAAAGANARAFVSLCYLHYALADRLTFDFVTEALWRRHVAGDGAVSRADLLDFLDDAAEREPQVRRWTESSRRHLAGAILTSLRDFGVLAGSQRKRIVRPELPGSTALHLLRILVAEGVAGMGVLEDPTWRLFMCTPGDVAHTLSRLAQEGHVRFERSGRTVVLEVPTDWKRPA